MNLCMAPCALGVQAQCSNTVPVGMSPRKCSPCHNCYSCWSSQYTAMSSLPSKLCPMTPQGRGPGRVPGHSRCTVSPAECLPEADGLIPRATQSSMAEARAHAHLHVTVIYACWLEISGNDFLQPGREARD